jgi:hypothetical protein
LIILAALQVTFAQGKPAIAGIWRGQSSCTQKKSACSDETVVYRFSPLQDKPGSFSVSADKIVDGKTVNMGVLEFHYVEDQQALVCKYAQGVWRLTLDGSKMEGTLTHPDGSLFRRVFLHKEE